MDYSIHVPIMSEVFRPVDWIHSSNIYEVNLRQYTPEGTIVAFARQMPRLREMGIDILWFMPITPISHDHRLGTLGSYYACSDYTAINPEYGTLDDFTQLVKEAHALGFKVIIDIVANHTGWDHRWTREHPDYYRRNAEGQFFDPHGWADVIDLNYDNPGLRQAMIDVMKFWIAQSWAPRRTLMQEKSKVFLESLCLAACRHRPGCAHLQRVVIGRIKLWAADRTGRCWHSNPNCRRSRTPKP